MSSPPITSVLVHLASPVERGRPDWGSPYKVSIWRGESTLPETLKFDRPGQAFSAAVQALLKMTLPEEGKQAPESTIEEPKMEPEIPGYQLLSTGEVSKIVGVGMGCLAVWRSKGKGPPFIRIPVGGGSRRLVRYRAEELFQWARPELRTVAFDERNRAIWLTRYESKLTYAAIGRIHNIHRERVRQIIAKVEKKLHEMTLPEG